MWPGKPPQPQEVRHYRRRCSLVSPPSATTAIKPREAAKQGVPVMEPRERAAPPTPRRMVRHRSSVKHGVVAMGAMAVGHFPQTLDAAMFKINSNINVNNKINVKK